MRIRDPVLMAAVSAIAIGTITAWAADSKIAFSEVQAPHQESGYEVVVFLDQCDPDAKNQRGCIEQFTEKMIQELEKAHRLLLRPEPFGIPKLLEASGQQEPWLPSKWTPPATFLALAK